MANKAPDEIKVQRGLSLKRRTHREVSDLADRMGVRWNDLVEGWVEAGLVSARAFAPVMPKLPIGMEKRHDEIELEVD